ncbi:MAG TPA: hypothetical protein DCS93_35345 [Microscillaceae bacterium]|nr:hypothetical protein [Microscillaceae bacterium]
MNHYQRLGVTKETTLKEVEQAYQNRLQKYQTQAKQGLIIDKEIEAELEKSYQVVTNFLLDTQRKKIPHGIKFLLMVVAGTAIIFSPVWLAQAFENDKLLALIPVFFVLLIVLNAILSARKVSKTSNGTMYIPNAKDNRKQSQKSAIWIGCILLGVCLVGYAVGEETIDDNEGFIYLGVGLLTFIWGATMSIKDWRASHNKNR